MKHLLYFGLVLLMGCSASALEETAGGEKLLFLIHAKQADFQRHEGNPAYAILTLSDVSPSVSYYTDPPYRQAGTMPLEDFLEQWAKGTMRFQKVPTSAGFVFYEGREHRYHDVSVELRRPIYNPTADRLQFEVYFIGHFDRESISDVTLFIDVDTAFNQGLENGGAL